MGTRGRPGGSTVCTIKSFAACLFVLGLSFTPSVALAQQDQSSTGDPVADAARKTREQKKIAPKPKKVFTEDDIAPKPAADAPAPSNVSSNPDKSDSGIAQVTTSISKNHQSPHNENP